MLTLLIYYSMNQASIVKRPLRLSPAVNLALPGHH